jgi:hypothetical protein
MMRKTGIGILVLLSVITSSVAHITLPHLDCLSPNTNCGPYYLDAPWRVSPEKTSIPIVVYLDIGLPVNRINIIDANSGVIVASNVYEPPLFLWEGILPYPVSFEIEKNRLYVNSNGSAKIKAEIRTLNYVYPDVDPINIKINTQGIPKLEKYFCGDTHYHSDYTNNAVNDFLLEELQSVSGEHATLLTIKEVKQ